MLFISQIPCIMLDLLKRTLCLQVLGLKKEMGALIHTMVEESSPEAAQVAKEVRDTLDIREIKNFINACYLVHTVSENTQSWRTIILIITMLK